MEPQFSIIVPTHNSRDVIQLLLESISRQTYKDFETIVVDDNSSDDTPDIISKYAVNLYRIKKNMGASYARNYGAKKAKGSILVFFDSDVILYDDVMSRFYERFRKGDIKVLIGRYAEKPANLGFVQEFKAIQEQAWYSNVSLHDAKPFTPYVGAIDRDLFFEVGGFDEGYRDANVEDYKFTLGLEKKTKIHHDREIKVKHHFPGFKKLIKSYFTRCFLWTSIFLNQQRFDDITTTQRQGYVYVFYVLSVLSLILSFYKTIFLITSCGFFIAALYFDKGFLKLLYKHKGLFFTISATIFNMFLSVIVVFAAISGFIFYKSRRRLQS